MAELLKQTDGCALSLSAFAREFGLSRETVSKRLDEANVKPFDFKRGHPIYPVGESARAILLPVKKTMTPVTDPDLLGPKDRLDWMRSENERLKLEKEQGLLIDAEECRMQMSVIVKTGLSVIETLPNILERDYELDPEIVEQLESTIDQLRNNWAHLLAKE